MIPVTCVHVFDYMWVICKSIPSDKLYGSDNEGSLNLGTLITAKKPWKHFFSHGIKTASSVKCVYKMQRSLKSIKDKN